MQLTLISIEATVMHDEKFASLCRSGDELRPNKAFESVALHSPTLERKRFDIQGPRVVPFFLRCSVGAASLSR
jgi:hypothetical protein